MPIWFQVFFNFQHICWLTCIISWVSFSILGGIIKYAIILLKIFATRWWYTESLCNIFMWARFYVSLTLFLFAYMPDFCRGHTLSGGCFYVISLMQHWFFLVFPIFTFYFFTFFILLLSKNTFLHIHSKFIGHKIKTKNYIQLKLTGSGPPLPPSIITLSLPIVN